MGLDYADDLSECDYEYWLKLDLVTIIQISFIASGNEPPRDNGDFFRHPTDYHDQHKVYNLLLNAMEANKIKTTSKDEISAKASPLEWLTYLTRKCYSLPQCLGSFLFANLPCGIPMEDEDMQPLQRSKDSYQNKEVRGDDKVLRAVIQTLLDLYPDLPKAELVKLRPISHYANGASHHEESLMKMISEIEGKNRGGGRMSSEKLEKIKKDIPKHWLPIPKKA
jgi:hypothetical protein